MSKKFIHNKKHLPIEGGILMQGKHGQKLGKCMCVPRLALDKYVALYVVCYLRKPQTTQAPLQLIKISG